MALIRYFLLLVLLSNGAIETAEVCTYRGAARVAQTLKHRNMTCVDFRDYTFTFANTGTVSDLNSDTAAKLRTTHKKQL